MGTFEQDRDEFWRIEKLKELYTEGCPPGHGLSKWISTDEAQNMFGVDRSNPKIDRKISKPSLKDRIMAAYRAFKDC